jgi:nicotinamide riboside kinase
MPPPGPLKIAFVGTHGVGKTTLCYALAARLKQQHLSVEVVHEVARRCPLPINEYTSREAQRWIFFEQLAEEILGGTRAPVLLCDRSLLDNYVYLVLAHGPDPLLEPLLQSWMSTYDLLVLVPRRTLLQPDGLRATDPRFQERIEELVVSELHRRGLPYFRLDPDQLSFWLGEVEKKALDLLGFAQLSLFPESATQQREPPVPVDLAPPHPGRALAPETGPTEEPSTPEGEPLPPPAREAAFRNL